MCTKCKKSSCSGCGSEGQQIAELLNTIQDLKDIVSQVQEDTKFLNGGHPIVMLYDAPSIAMFDTDSGLGAQTYEGWALCDGQLQEAVKTGLPFQTPPLLDKFIVAAGDTYAVGDTGGSDSVTLDTTQIPAHNHPLTDPGHNHGITDPGHDHGASSGPHTHTFTGDPHGHTADDEDAHTHPLNPSVYSIDENGGTGPFGPAVGALVSGTNYGGLNTNAGTAHTHVISDATGSGTVGNTSVGVDVDPSFAGVTVNNANTGATIQNTGGGLSHENRPPFFALVYIVKL